VQCFREYFQEVRKCHTDVTVLIEVEESETDIHSSFLFLMISKTFLYGENFWKEKLGSKSDMKKYSIDQKLHLIFSLIIIYLNVNIVKLLFTFESNIADVRNRAGRFLGHTPTAPTECYSTYGTRTFLNKPCFFFLEINSWWRKASEFEDSGCCDKFHHGFSTNPEI
jgi:hypothetical protein